MLLYWKKKVAQISGKRHICISVTASAIYILQHKRHQCEGLFPSAPSHSPGPAPQLWQPSNNGQAKVGGKKEKKKKNKEKKPKPKTEAPVTPPLLLPTIQVRAPAWELLAVCSEGSCTAQTPLQPPPPLLEKLAPLQPPAAGMDTRGGGRDQVLSGVGTAHPDTSTTILCPPPPVTSHKLHGDAEQPEEQQTRFRRCWEEAQRHPRPPSCRSHVRKLSHCKPLERWRGEFAGSGPRKHNAGSPPCASSHRPTEASADLY